MDTYSTGAPPLSAASSNGSPSVSSDSPGTATSSSAPHLSATTDARLAQPPAPPAVPAACLACRSKHLKCDGSTPCSRCTSSNTLCEYVASRRGYKGPRKHQSQQHPNKRHASSSPPYAGGPSDSYPMMMGHHTPLSLAAAGVAGYNSGMILPDQSPISYTTPSPLVPLYSTPFVSGMDANALALATTPALPVHTPLPPVPTLAERCFEAFYHYFHAGHPFVLPKEYFIRLLKDGTAPNLNVVVAAMRYIGCLYIVGDVAKVALENFRDEALRLCYLPTTPKDGFLIQALLLLIIGLDGEANQSKARELLADCERFAIEIDLNKREFAALHGRGNPVLEESWRRTWWDLYVCDGMIAGVHRITKFLLYTIPADVGLPCEELEYISGRIPHPPFIEDLENQDFTDEDRDFSSFAYRIAAIRNLGRFMYTPPMMFADEEGISRVEAMLSNWKLHLPPSKRDDLSKDCQLDEMMFQAHFIIHACTIMLHQIFSQLDTSPVQGVTSCAPYRPNPSGDAYNAHTRHVITAASEISKMITQAVPILRHSHFFTCVITMSSIVHLSRWARYMLLDDYDLRQQIRLNVGGLKELSMVWKGAEAAWDQVRQVGRDIYREKQAAQITPAYWVNFTREQMMTSIAVDDGIISDFNLLGGAVTQG